MERGWRDYPRRGIFTLRFGLSCTCDAIHAYHEFFMEHIPDAPKLYMNYMDEILAREGYTYDEEGNEYKDGVFIDFSGKSSQQLVFAMLRMTLHGEPLYNERIKKYLSNLFIQEFVVSLQH